MGLDYFALPGNHAVLVSDSNAGFKHYKIFLVQAAKRGPIQTMGNVS